MAVSLGDWFLRLAKATRGPWWISMPRVENSLAGHIHPDELLVAADLPMAGNTGPQAPR